MVVLEAALRSLYETHAPRIRRYVARIVGEADAEDVTQEAFARAHRGMESRRGDSSLSTWLYRIATNAAVDRLRSAAARHEVGETPDDVEPAALLVEGGGCGGDADGRVIRKEMSGCILGLVDRLPPPHREVILLGELRDLSDREIAETLGIGLEAAKMRLHRARRQLRSLLEGSCTLYRDDRNELACEPKGPSRR